ncbi:MAG: homoserine O-acetyltransferase [Candidatus Bathyarchaeota archaeon]|nr:MAG: homoserine O-acetyltransferase [Candidatus Bathyarchaeota archaeon]
MNEDVGSVGNTQTQHYSFENSEGQILESGEKLEQVTIAYETYGKLNPQQSNAILVLHAFSGSAHAAGFHKNDKHPGWWDTMIGPGKAFDTEKYFVICSNVIAGCNGSTGPSSVNPKTGKAYGTDFPVVTINDMVKAQHRLVNHLRIKKLHAVVGGSMGGMQVLQWMVSYPEKVLSAIPIATTLKHSPQQIAFNEVGRQAVMADPNWNDGNYYGSSLPSRGLAVARMVGHITYMSDASMANKFGRRLKDSKKQFKFGTDFEVECYLQHRGDNFVKRFDANSYLYITKAMDYFNLVNGKKLSEIFRGLKAKVLVLSFKSDWLYPAHQSREIVKACKLAGVDTTYCEINSTYGHDAFLLEVKEETHLIKHFLRTVSNGHTKELN